MLRNLIMIVVLTTAGCSVEYKEGMWPYQVAPLSIEGRKEGERLKQLLVLEDLKIGTGAVAAWGRKISAQITARYADGTLVYDGPAFTYYGFKGMPETSSYDERLLGGTQTGILIGLNGMAVGGKRRMTIDRSKVCSTLKMDADPRAECILVGRSRIKGSLVRKEALIVEATLTESCIPVVIRGYILKYGFYWEVTCRAQSEPRLDLSLPISHFYG
jgi:hypothetical protein